VKISLITAVYNNRDTLPNALDSALSQTYAEVEHIVIDGGSTDGTLETLRSYENRLALVISEPDQGIYDALNKGILLASGDVIGFLHSDDLFNDDFVLGRVADAFSNFQVDAVYGDLKYVQKDNLERVVRYWQAGAFSRSRLGWGWMAPHPTFFVRRRVYECLGLFDVSYRIAADYDFMIRLLSSDAVQVAYVPHVLVKMRLGGVSNRSLKNIVQKTMEDYRVLKSNKVGGLGALVLKNFSKLEQFWTR